MKEIINNFSKRHQIWRAAAHDEMRPVMNYIFFENGFAYASDAHILVRIPIGYISYFDDDENKKLNGHGIYAPAYKFITSLGILQIEECKIKTPKGMEDGICFVGCMDSCEVRVNLTNPSQHKHPDYDPLFNMPGERTPIKRIGLSQKYLGRLTAALGTPDVKMEFIDNKRSIFVSPISALETGSEAVIMPIALTGTLEGFD